jgi:hypothetical protein
MQGKTALPGNAVHAHRAARAFRAGRAYFRPVQLA